MSPDGLVMFMNANNRSGGLGSYDTWMIRRPYKGAAWSEPVNLGSSFNTSRGEVLASLSPDGRWAYIAEHDYQGPVQSREIAAGTGVSGAT